MNKIILLVFSLFLFACSASEDMQEQSDADDNVYVFDDAQTKPDTNETVTFELPPPVEEVQEPEQPTIVYDYYVQVGAFSTKDRADKFISKAQKLTSEPLNVFYDNEKKYFLVKTNILSEREQADIILKELLKQEEFKDAFIRKVRK